MTDSATALPWLSSSRTRRPAPQVLRALDRHLHVDLESGVLIDRRQDRIGLHAVADADRDVADDAGGGRGDAEVLQLDLVLAHSGVVRGPRRLGGPDRGFGLVVLLLTDGADLEQLLGPLELLLGVVDCRLLRRTGRLFALHRRLLLRGIDLQQRLATGNGVSRAHVDMRDDAFDLRPDFGRASRLQDRHEFGADGDGLGREDLDADRKGWHLLEARWLPFRACERQPPRRSPRMPGTQTEIVNVALNAAWPQA